MPFNPKTQHGFKFNPVQPPTSIPPTEDQDRKLGTYGTAGPNGQVSSVALSLDTIENLTTLSGVTNELRKRIVKIAFSYVGNNEVKGNNLGWHDKIFEAKMKNWSDINMKWSSPMAWCNCFTNLVWKEAYTTGNALVPATTEYQSIWDTKLNGGKLNPLSRGVSSTNQYFQAKKQFINFSEAKAGTLLPEPGDMISFNYPGGGHIGLVVGTKVVNGKLTDVATVEGNVGPKDPRDGGGLVYYPTISNYGWKYVAGFCRVIF
jgi:hypothetical protein